MQDLQGDAVRVPQVRALEDGRHAADADEAVHSVLPAERPADARAGLLEQFVGGIVHPGSVSLDPREVHSTTKHMRSASRAASSLGGRGCRGACVRGVTCRRAGIRTCSRVLVGRHADACAKAPAERRSTDDRARSRTSRWRHRPEIVRGVVEHGASLHVCGPVTALASWPAPLSPQHTTSPLETSAHADASRIAIADGPRNPDTVTGDHRGTRVWTHQGASAATFADGLECRRRGVQDHSWCPARSCGVASGPLSAPRRSSLHALTSGLAALRAAPRSGRPRPHRRSRKPGLALRRTRTRRRRARPASRATTRAPRLRRRTRSIVKTTCARPATMSTSPRRGRSVPCSPWPATSSRALPACRLA